ncbi:rCG21275 [Rattus norvegicus]|uniref:RCG21275 n=1 Tax=Rattus norvegicus TaxID=10116 RepID=A6J120_RAT|nr:rCG21275 [Rattus norvegicus]
MGHLQMRSQRGRSCCRQSCGVGLPQTHSVPWPTPAAQPAA